MDLATLAEPIPFGRELGYPRRKRQATSRSA